jgi:hypothetical protein
VRLERRHVYGKLFYTARFVLGEVSEREFESQPCRLFLRARLVFARALRAELQRERELARQHYGAYLELPYLERSVDSVRRDPLVQRWAEFRAA